MIKNSISDLSEEEIKNLRFLPVEVELELLDEQLSHPYPTNTDEDPALEMDD